MEILLEQFAKRFFGGAGRRTVVVGEVEVCDAEVESAACDGPSVLELVDAAEVLPPPKRYRGELEAAFACAVVGHCVVTGI